MQQKNLFHYNIMCLVLPGSDRMNSWSTHWTGCSNWLLTPPIM